MGAFASLIALPLLSLLPAEWIQRTGEAKEFEHFIAYCGTALLLALGIGSRWLRVSATLALIGLAGGLELAQNLTATRSAEIEQFLGSAAGALTGFAIGSLARHLLSRHLNDA